MAILYNQRVNRHIHILQIVIKNTSTIDFTLPLFWELQKKSGSKLSILYCVFDKKQILRKSMFYSDSFKQFNVQEYDFAEFLKKPFKHMKFLLRWLFSQSPADKIHLRGEYKNYRKERSGLEPLLPFIFYLLKSHSIKSILSSIVSNFLFYLEQSIGPKIIRLEKILPELNADVILFDNRAKTTFYGRNLFYKYFNKVKRPVILLPHAPHLRDLVSEFCPFDTKGDPLPDYCDFWIPLRFGTPWVKVPERKKQFSTIGYPGFDSKWLQYLIRKDQARITETGGKTVTGKKKKCLFIIRRYLPTGQCRPAGLDPFIIDYDDFNEPLKALVHAINMYEEEIELLIKPHPSNNYKILTEDLNKAGISNWKITYEPIYALLKEIDIVISLFSTILLVPAIAGIPTIVINSKLQQHVHQGWDLLREMYTGMKFYVEDVEQFPKKFRDILTEIKTGDKNYFDSNINHLRYFFPDGAIKNAIERIERLTRKSEKSIASVI